MKHVIAVAAPTYPTSVQHALNQIDQLSAAAKRKGAKIICFPETFLPGYPWYGAARISKEELEVAFGQACHIAARNQIALIVPMDWYEADIFLNVAQVISATGQPLGYQTKNQLDPSEDEMWSAGTQRKLFEVDGLKFGITICHEGFRYPETVRWAAREGAALVFHPNLTGSNTEGVVPAEWGAKSSPYYEKAQMVRAIENTIYFAPSNYALPYPESASAIISPAGECLAYQRYAEPGIAVAEIDTDLATGLLARRFKPALY
jgi:5-aminopentanamidase